MKSKTKIPVALTIAGSDSGGGAGIQADLKTFAACGVHGVSVITCLTAQNPKKIFRVEPVSMPMFRAQLEAVRPFKPRAAKTGMLYSAEIIREVVRFFEKKPGIKLVVDPVMIATSGRQLLQKDALDLLEKKLLPLAFLITPNLPEAERLLGEKITTSEEMKQSARALNKKYGCAVLLKGGHLSGAKEAVDFLCDGREEWSFPAPFIAGPSLHGTGCTYAAAITAGLAGGEDFVQAIFLAKEYITSLIESHRIAANFPVLSTPLR